ncbi:MULTISPECIES: alpha/beta hydrolase [unclassified Pigmentiphaga]|uniref:alpha/beta hydrolase n=1 Tax=unclassified Pigmentiphaga TaxID=2626614 RepID=UPI000B411A10|nr:MULTISPECIES: alpha/beta hydrolase [unclassified Pigmentiphaga]OVZ66432.1 alpha/beta hydrolase [Pigmentiphaga sp. NML030171]
MPPLQPIVADWVHLQYPESSAFRDTYGFNSSQGLVHLEGIRYMPSGASSDHSSDTLLIYMHPASTLQLLPLPKAMVQQGLHVLCAASRYARNDTALIFEKVLLDLGAFMRHARETWRYKNVLIVGWSGGGSLSLLYQSQAEHPTITETPAGDPIDIKKGCLIPADGIILPASHLSRARLLREWIDPSVLDEDDPDRRDVELDLYNPANPNQTPYSAEYLQRFRAAQLARIRRRTAWVKETLRRLTAAGGKEVERGFVTHRTMADPRFLDPAIDPNLRIPGTCFLGNPETVNSSPIGVGRFSTLRSWLSQWSIEDSQADGEKCAAQISAPLLAIENSADDAVPQPHTKLVYNAAGSTDKTYKVVEGANHYYAGQPEHLATAAKFCIDWLRERNWAA